MGNDGKSQKRTLKTLLMRDKTDSEETRNGERIIVDSEERKIDNNNDDISNNNKNKNDAHGANQAKRLQKGAEKKSEHQRRLHSQTRTSRTSRKQKKRIKREKIKTILVHSVRNFDDEGSDVFEKERCPEKRCQITHDLRYGRSI